MDNDGKQWAAWFDRHAPGLLLFARQIVGQHAEAEDAVQEGFVRFWRNRSEARDPAAYAYTCVRRCALDQLRRRSRRRRRETEVGSERPPWFDMADRHTEDRVEGVQRALSQLPDLQRQVVVLKIWGQLTFSQIAESLGISSNTAASRYRYALEKMRGELHGATSHE